MAEYPSGLQTRIMCPVVSNPSDGKHYQRRQYRGYKMDENRENIHQNRRSGYKNRL